MLVHNYYNINLYSSEIEYKLLNLGRRGLKYSFGNHIKLFAASK